MYQLNFNRRHVFQIVALALTMVTASHATESPLSPDKSGAETIEVTNTVFNFNELALECAKQVHPNTLQALVRTESAFNPYAIGVVGGSIKQPTNFTDAVAAAKKLDAEGKNFSMGLAQINRYNLAKYDLDYETVFDPCKNLFVGQEILAECFGRAGVSSQETLQKALSCYYSGNFRTGFRQDLKGLPSYVERIRQAATKNNDEEVVRTVLGDDVAKAEITAAVIPEIDVSAPVAKPVAKARVAKATKPRTEQAKVVKVSTSVDLLAKDKPERKNNWDILGDW